eukprot:scaffold5017_cov75-Phaeocystis_antarctica.AAC.6
MLLGVAGAPEGGLRRARRTTSQDSLGKRAVPGSGDLPPDRRGISPAVSAYPILPRHGLIIPSLCPVRVLPTFLPLMDARGFSPRTSRLGRTSRRGSNLPRPGLHLLMAPGCNSPLAKHAVIRRPRNQAQRDEHTTRP